MNSISGIGRTVGSWVIAEGFARKNEKCPEGECPDGPRPYPFPEPGPRPGRDKDPKNPSAPKSGM